MSELLLSERDETGYTLCEFMKTLDNGMYDTIIAVTD
jgi:hypothetical protein